MCDISHGGVNSHQRSMAYRKRGAAAWRSEMAKKYGESVAASGVVPMANGAAWRKRNI